MPKASTDAPALDGRHARSERTRAAIVDAVLDLYREGILTPRIDDIAARVGISKRSIFNHFADIEALAAAVGSHQFESHRELLSPAPATGALAQRIDAIVTHRADLYETIAPVRRAAVVNVHTNREVARQQERSARSLRRQLATTFASEIDRSTPQLLDAIDLVTSWEAWERLRQRQGLSVATARALVADMLHDHLSPHEMP